MTDRAEMEKIVRAAYAARVRGDVEEVVRCFAPDAHFELRGDPTASPVPVRTAGADQLRPRMAELTRLFTFHNHEIITLVIDGANVALRSRVALTSTLTGRTVETELADFIEVKDGRITSFVQYCDTALAAKLLAP
jgi:ketosteroid isomerase-like protein